MSVTKWFFKVWKSRGNQVRNRLLKHILLVFSILILVFVLLGGWQYLQIRSEILDKSSQDVLSRAYNRYSGIIEEQERLVIWLSNISKDSSLSPSQLSTISKSLIDGNYQFNSVTWQTNGLAIHVNKKQVVTDSKLIHDSLIQSKTVLWSDPMYLDLDSTFVVSTVHKSEESQWAVALNFDIRVLHFMLENMNLTKHAEVFLFRKSNLSVFNPILPQLSKGNNQQLFLPFQMANSVLISKALEQVRNHGKLDAVEVVNSNGNLIWFRSKPLNSSNDQLMLGVVIPELDMMELVRHQVKNVALFLLFFFLLSALLLSFILNRYSNLIRDLPQLHINTAKADFELPQLIAKGESKHLEFKSTVRFNLHTKQHDKNIESAWLKGVAGFLNTEGGILLIGIDDKGEVLGIKDVNFANDDKAILHIKNLLSKYLGVSVMKFISIEILKLKSTKQVVLLEVEPSKKPVYYKYNNEDVFFTRNGPSSTKLSVSEAVAYIADKF